MLFCHHLTLVRKPIGEIDLTARRIPCAKLISTRTHTRVALDVLFSRAKLAQRTLR